MKKELAISLSLGQVDAANRLHERLSQWQLTCDGYLDHPFLEKRYKTRKQSSDLKMNWPLLSACHAGLLADNQTPVGSVRLFICIFLLLMESQLCRLDVSSLCAGSRGSAFSNPLFSADTSSAYSRCAGPGLAASHALPHLHSSA